MFLKLLSHLYADFSLGCFTWPGDWLQDCMITGHTQKVTLILFQRSLWMITKYWWHYFVGMKKLVSFERYSLCYQSFNFYSFAMANVVSKHLAFLWNLASWYCKVITFNWRMTYKDRIFFFLKTTAYTQITMIAEKLVYTYLFLPILLKTFSPPDTLKWWKCAWRLGCQNQTNKFYN